MKQHQDSELDYQEIDYGGAGAAQSPIICMSLQHLQRSRPGSCVGQCDHASCSTCFSMLGPNCSTKPTS